MDLENEPDVIRNSGQMTSILRRLHEARMLLDVHLPGRGIPYRSAVLYVDVEQHLITLDELHPKRGHKRVEPGTPLRVVSRTFGVDTRFVAIVDTIGIESGIHYYIAPFPEEIIYHQRRRFVRVPVPSRHQTHCWLQMGDDNRIGIQLCDLSAGGIGAYVTDSGEPEPGKRYQCHIGLTGTGTFETEVEVRYCAYDRMRKRSRFGAQFTAFNDAERSRLQRVVLSLQRELLRST